MADFSPYNYAAAASAGNQLAMQEMQGRQAGQQMQEQNAIKQLMRSSNPQEALRTAGYTQQAQDLSLKDAEFQLKGLEFVKKFAPTIANEGQYLNFKNTSERLGFSKPGILPEKYDDTTKALLKTLAGNAVQQYETIAGPGGSILQRETATGKMSQVIGRPPKGTTVNVGGEKVSPGFKEVDKSFAKEYVDWKARGGFADVRKNLAQLGRAYGKLTTKQVETGPVNILNPDIIKGLTSPELKDVKQQVEEVVQRNLRMILGAQFTEKEGERLISRAFDDTLPTEVNAVRVNRLMTQIRDAALAKQEAVMYFNKKGTLQGFEGKTYGSADFSPESLFGEGGATGSYGTPEATKIIGNTEYHKVGGQWRPVVR